jgi:uncharacterized membrane protein
MRKLLIAGFLAAGTTLVLLPQAGSTILVACGYCDRTILIVLVTIIMVLSLPIWAVHTPYLAESFRSGIRSSGYGVNYSLATIIPGL